jgi:prevent-host-death family protein
MKASSPRVHTGPNSDRARRPRSKQQVASVRNPRGELIQQSSVTASDAKAEFARVLELAAQGGAVVVTKHDAPKAVVISVDNFNALAAAAESSLDTLDREFDTLLAQMQTPKARRGMKRAFDASGTELGRSAAAATRRRRG